MTICHETDVCIVGGGQAGMLLGLLLAHQGIQTLVLEQHRDFSREYRGEVLMPRFSQLFKGLGLLEYIESYPHSKLNAVEIFAQDKSMAYIDFQAIYPPHPYALWMPQPIFLDALWQKGRIFEGFQLWFGTSVERLIQENGKTIGVIARQGEQKLEVKARLTVGADGRTSRIHRLGQFKNAYESYEFDVIWFSLPRPDDYQTSAGLHFCKGNTGYLVLPKYPNLLQCGVLTRPGAFSTLRNQGSEKTREVLLKGPKLVQAFARELRDFTPFHPLQARISYTEEWARDGLLLIGDAAHTCSPAGAIGVSIALETAAVAADVIVNALAKNDVSQQALSQVQARRGEAIQEIQRIQAQIPRILFSPVPGLMSILPYVAKFASFLGIAPQLPKKLLVEQHPIALPRKFYFD